jgi:hypothetical protein
MVPQAHSGFLLQRNLKLILLAAAVAIVLALIVRRLFKKNP